jgi:carbamate kinase
MMIVAALGGKALQRHGERPDAELQKRLAVAAVVLAPLAERHELIVTHGNGPHVGLLDALRHELPDYEVVSVVEAGLIGRLIAPKTVIVWAAGGGIPLTGGRDGSGGIEADVDQDRTAALLAVRVGAHRLLLLTDVDAVMDGWGSAAPRPIGSAGVSWFRRHSFASGSMGPKVDAACRFVERTGRPAFIGALDQAEAILGGRSGTKVTWSPTVSA